MPAQVLGQPAADERAGDERDAEHGPEEALVLAALLRAEQVADDRERDREQRACADALDAAEQDQHAHVLTEAGQRGADQEDDDADHVDRLAAVEVGQLAPERDADRAGEQVDGDRPDVVVVATQLGHDGRQGRADDGLVERAQEQPEHDREEDLQLLAVRQAEGGVVLERRCEPAVTGGECFHESFSPSLGVRWLWWAPERWSAIVCVDGDPKVGDGRRDADELAGGRDDRAIRSSRAVSRQLDIVEHLATRPAVIRTSTIRRSLRDADPLDEAPFLDPVDETRGGRERDIEHVGEPAHRQLAVALEQVHDVQLGHADAEADEAFAADALELAHRRAGSRR